MTVIKKIKQVGKVTFYDTGIKVNPDTGYFVSVYPRSSLSKTGYMLANSVGIIDQTYTGNIIIALMKVDEEMPDLKLPQRVAQMVVQPAIHCNIIFEEDIEETARSAGGFGSTGTH